MKTIGLKIVVPVEAQNETLQDEVEIEEVVDETAEEVVDETAEEVVDETAEEVVDETAEEVVDETAKKGKNKK